MSPGSGATTVITFSFSRTPPPASASASLRGDALDFRRNSSSFSSSSPSHSATARAKAVQPTTAQSPRFPPRGAKVLLAVVVRVGRSELGISSTTEIIEAY